MSTNTGNHNTGNRNSGNLNSGNRNSGNLNSGHYNSGYCNSGRYNSGEFNSGESNSGDSNSGHRNSGDHNSGYCNSGHYNSGEFNSGDYNNGFFNTGSPDKIMLFDKWVNMSRQEVMEKHPVLCDIRPQLIEWVHTGEMTDKEKKDHPEHGATGGYLKVLTYKEAWAKWWHENENKHEAIKALPNFDAEVFKRITGIDVNTKEKTIIIEGKEYTMSEIKKALGK